MRAVAGPLDRWIVLPLMRAMGRRRRVAMLARASLAAVARSLELEGPPPGLPGWTIVPTPGHTPGHVAFFRPADRVLLSGDALVILRVNSLSGMLLAGEGLSVPPWYTTWDRRGAGASIARLAALEPTVVGGGHGSPMIGGTTAALVRAFADRGTSS